jgi:hypothetical protein
MERRRAGHDAALVRDAEALCLCLRLPFRAAPLSIILVICLGRSAFYADVSVVEGVPIFFDVAHSDQTPFRVIRLRGEEYGAILSRLNTTVRTASHAFQATQLASNSALAISSVAI